MKRSIGCLLIVCVFLAMIMPVQAEATADDVFALASTSLDSSGIAEFFAITILAQTSISVTGCLLYKKNNNNLWICECSLPTPSLIATNTTLYTTSIDYSSYINSGTYRVFVTFCAGGHYVSRFSNTITN